MAPRRTPEASRALPAAGGLTADEPYQPQFDDPADVRELLRATRSEVGRTVDANLGGRWQPPQGRTGRTLLPEIDGSTLASLAQLEAKLARGESATGEEIDRVLLQLALRVARSRRPTAAASALKTLARIEEPRRKRREAEQAAEEKRKRRRTEWAQEDATLSLPQ